jgi:neurofibromin 1
MDSDAGLVGSLVDRLATRLPHRTGTNEQTLYEDSILQITRATLVELSKSAIEAVLESLIGLLEGLARPYESVASHPDHVLLSELHVLALAADCCSARWAILSHDIRSNETSDDQIRDGIDNSIEKTKPLPPLDDKLVHRVLDALRILLEPIPDDYMLPAHTLLEQVAKRNVTIPRLRRSSAPPPASKLLDSHLAELDTYVKVVVEYVTASSWSTSFEYFRNAVYSIRSSMATGSIDIPKSSLEAEAAALVVVRLLSFFWVDGSKLRLIIQEICSSYLHFRRPYQNAVAVVVPLLITRWIDRFPKEFVECHVRRRRLDVSADTLFDMAQRVSDNGKPRALFFPLQTTLLFLLPEIFEVASNLKEAKSSGIVKKVTFLDGLRKSLRNGHETAAFCLVSLLRVARHFDAESDSALVSYAMDVQDEVRDAVFRRNPSATGSPSPTSALDVPTFDQDTMTAAFVSLAHLNLGGSVNTLVGNCISRSAPDSFKIAAVQGCCYFARQPYAPQYHELFDQVLPFMQTQLEVFNRPLSFTFGL